LTCATLGASASTPEHDEHAAITVFAAASLTDAVTEIAERFERDTRHRVRLSFAASSTLARQIATGAPADIYISGNVRWMDYLAEQDLIKPTTRRDVVNNRLVLIASEKAAGIDVRFEPDFDWRSVLHGRLAIADPSHAPAGIYAQQALTSLGWWNTLHDRTAPAANVRDALRLVETRQCDFGIVYASDVSPGSNVRVIATFPETTHEAIRYPAAVVNPLMPRNQATQSAARSFVDRLASSVAADIFERHGFAPIDSRTTVADSAPTETNTGKVSAGITSQEWSALLLSLKVAACCIAVLALPGIACGWLLARGRFPGKMLLDILVHAPLVLPPIVTGYLVLLVLGRGGLLGKHLNAVFGVNIAFTWYGAVIVAAIMGFPLMVRSVRLAVELVDRRIEQAASTLGANPLRVWLTVTLPLALPGVVAGLFLAFARSLGEFGATITFAGNIEGQTRTLPLAIFTSIQTPGGDAPAMRLALISVLLSVGALAASAIVERRLRLAREV
jgi:molybdate transport system permease protein